MARLRVVVSHKQLPEELTFEVDRNLFTRAGMGNGFAQDQVAKYTQEAAELHFRRTFKAFRWY